MKRWAVNLFCLFSLLVFVSSVTIWVRSYFVGDYIGRRNFKKDFVAQCYVSRAYDVEFAIGAIKLHHESVGSRGHDWSDPEHGWEHATFPPEMRFLEPNASGNLANIHFAGFSLRCVAFADKPGWYQWQQLVLPLWLFLPAAVPPFLWWRKWRKKGGRGFPVGMGERMKEEGGGMKVEEDQRIV